MNLGPDVFPGSFIGMLGLDFRFFGSGSGFLDLAISVLQDWIFILLRIFMLTVFSGSLVVFRSYRLFVLSDTNMASFRRPWKSIRQMCSVVRQREETFDEWND